jgi:hypothetical protein
MTSKHGSTGNTITFLARVAGGFGPWQKAKVSAKVIEALRFAKD